MNRRPMPRAFLFVVLALADLHVVWYQWLKKGREVDGFGPCHLNPGQETSIVPRAIGGLQETRTHHRCGLATQKTLAGYGQAAIAKSISQKLRLRK